MSPWRVGQGSRNQDLDDEIDHDFELEVDELIRSGLSREEAESAARRDFGNVLLIKEDIRETWGWAWMERIHRDARYAARNLGKNSGSTLMGLVSLSLAICVATALFSVIYGVLFEPYPFVRPNDILSVQMVPGYPSPGLPVRLGEYLELRKLPAFADVMADCMEDFILTGDRFAQPLHGILLSGTAFQFLGVRALLGRTILPSDVDPQGSVQPVVVLSYKAWQQWFGGNPDAIGETIVLNARARTVIGVMPPRFGWWTDIWLPLPLDRYDRVVSSRVRLRPGVSRESAERQLQTLLVRLASDDPNRFSGQGLTARLADASWKSADGGMETALRWLMLVAGFLLLISCANVANLQLTRATVRSREIAVRMAVGAGPWGVLRPLLIESVLLSLAGGVLGGLLSLPVIPALAAALPGFQGVRPDEVRIAMNGYVVLFPVAVSLLTGILCGLAPAARCSRANMLEALRDSPRTSTAGAAGGRTRNFLVIAEVALSVILIFAAIVTTRGFLVSRARSLDFQPVHLLKAGFSLPPKLYPSYEGRMFFAQTLLPRLKALPGVESAAMGSLGGLQSRLSVRGLHGNEPRRVSVGFISRDFAATLGIPLRRGREFTEQEIERRAPVGLVNESAARRFWPAGVSPIGTEVRLDLLENPGGSLGVASGSAPDLTIVGIVADTGIDNDLGTTHDPLILIPFTIAAPPWRKVFLRTAGDPMLLWNAVKREVQAIDRDETIDNPWTVEGSLGANEDLAQARFEMVVFGLVGLTGLILAAAGIYSVLAYTVACKTHEVGVRMALGATGPQVRTAMLRMGGRLVLIGLAAGILGSFLLASLVNTAVPKTDVWAIAAIIVLLIPPALLACYVPARRAVRLDPSAALRHE